MWSVKTGNVWNVNPALVKTQDDDVTDFTRLNLLESGVHKCWKKDKGVKVMLGLCSSGWLTSFVVRSFCGCSFQFWLIGLQINTQTIYNSAKTLLWSNIHLNLNTNAWSLVFSEIKKGRDIRHSFQPCKKCMFNITPAGITSLKARFIVHVLVFPSWVANEGQHKEWIWLKLCKILDFLNLDWQSLIISSWTVFYPPSLTL